MIAEYSVEINKEDMLSNVEWQRIWATKKIALILKENKLAEERQRAITEKNQSLKKVKINRFPSL